MTAVYAQPAPVTVPVDVGVTVLEPTTCSNTFVKHTLEHTTRAHGPEVTFYDSNGAGVAVGDLDDDDDLDIVLANLNGKNSILWNEGDLSFRKEELGYGNARAVQLIDVDGDGLLDIVFTQSLGSLSYWRNVQGTLKQDILRGVTRKAYTFVWGDLDADGDLDLVTASYDTLLEKELKDSFLFSSGAGVSVYENTPDGFVETRLAETSQALAVTLFDLNEDGKPDILVGNDFEVPDYAFLNTDEGWLAAAPFVRTTRNTMSFDGGRHRQRRLADELFATDMKPDFSDKKALAAWMPLDGERATSAKPVTACSARKTSFTERSETGFENLAYTPSSSTRRAGVGRAAFGDLDNDGRLDLYVVNGMMAKEVFSHLPNNELVEANQAFAANCNRFRACAGMGSGRARERARHDDGGLRQRRGLRHRYQQLGDARRSVRKSTVRWERARCRFSMAGERQHASPRRDFETSHQRRNAAA